MPIPEWPRAAPRCRGTSGTPDVAPADLEKVWDPCPGCRSIARVFSSFPRMPHPLSPRCVQVNESDPVLMVDQVRAAQVRGATALILFTSSVALIALTASLSPRTAPAKRLARAQPGALRPHVDQLYSTNVLGHAPYDEEIYLPDIVEPVVPDLHDLLKAQLIGRYSRPSSACAHAIFVHTRSRSHALTPPICRCM